MNLDLFYKNQKKYVDLFFEYWTFKNKKEPKNYPLEMLEGDWFEQFNFFTEFDQDFILKKEWEKI